MALLVCNEPTEQDGHNTRVLYRDGSIEVYSRTSAGTQKTPEDRFTIYMYIYINIYIYIYIWQRPKR